MEIDKLKLTHTPPMRVQVGSQTEEHLGNKMTFRDRNPTFGYWSYEPSGTLVVFVHGFLGDALGTWSGFPGRLQSSSQGKATDFVFYGYDSAKTGVEESGVNLYNFLDTLISSPADVVSSSMGLFGSRNPDFRFDRLLLVAHSLGAVVVRQCLREAAYNNSSWIGFSKMLLFAPAHRGANAAKLCAEGLANCGPFGVFISTFTALRYQSIRDLAPDSPFLERLHREVQDALTLNSNPAWCCQIANAVFWAPGDPVVINQRFANDPTAIIVPAASHTSICKPEQDYAIPLEALAKSIA